MIFFMDSRGGVRPATQREPSGTHWNVYHQAMGDMPDLCQAMYDTIADTVQSRFNEGTREFPNSSWLGREILSSWDRKTEWDVYCNEGTSGVLFGEIMWTYMWDDPNEWCTTITRNANEGREERVYFLQGRN